VGPHHHYRRRESMTTADIARNQVRPGPDQFIGSGRMGTVVAKLSELFLLIGPFETVDSIDGKVTMEWNFQTPRGPIATRDYWWNVRGLEWSIDCKDRRAIRWLVRYLRAMGVDANAVDGQRVSDYIGQRVTAEEIHAEQACCPRPAS